MGFHLIDPNYQSALDLMTTRPDAAVMEMCNRFVRKCRDMGILAALDGLYIFNADSQASCINLANPGNYTCTIIGAPTWGATGVTGTGGAACLRTNFVPSTAGGQFTQDSASMFVWSLTAALAAGTTQYDMGCATGSDLRIRQSNGNLAAAMNDGTALSVANGDATGLYAICRRAASGTGAKVVRKDLAQIATATTASSGLPSSNMFFLGRSAGGLSSRELMFGGFGANLSDDQCNALYWIGREYGFACGALT